MCIFRYNDRPSKGFTLIEVLIAFMILSFGLLGAIALQAKAKQASFDSLQRAAAIALGNDVIQRIRLNGTLELVNFYRKTITSKTPIKSSFVCFNSSCKASEIAALDIEQWKRAIRARENTGILDNTTLCINFNEITDTNSQAFNVEVIVVWQGRQKFKANQSTVQFICGESSERRRLVVITSYIYLRS